MVELGSNLNGSNEYCVIELQSQLYSVIKLQS